MTTMPAWVLELIRCPITRQKLDIASVELIERLRASLRDGKLMNRLGTNVMDDFQSGLLNESKSWFYPVVDDIPTLVPDEAIACSES